MEHMSMLNVLAEIASEKLQTDPTVMMIKKAENQQNLEMEKKALSSHLQQNQGKQMTLVQVSSLSDTSILRLFTVSQANELKRKFYFTCRLIPLQCEETFHSFGSEDKARNMMKKHLKMHLHDLLERFVDSESRENYILHSVEKSRCTSQNYFKANSRKHYSHKSELKSKLINEKENSSIDTSIPNGKSLTTYLWSRVSSSVNQGSAHSNFESHIPPVELHAHPVVSESSTKLSYGLGSPPVSEYNKTTSTQKYTSLYLTAPVAKNETKNTNISLDSSTKIIPIVNTLVRRNLNSPKQKVDINQQTSKGHKTIMNPVLNFATSATKPSNQGNIPSFCKTIVCSNAEVSSEGNAQNEISGVRNLNQKINLSKSNSIIMQNGGVKSEPTEIIEIKMESDVKMEILDISEQCKMTNVSHDHGYIVNENNTHFQVEKEEIVVSSDHSEHQEFIHSFTQTKNLTQEDSQEKKVRAKGKGKFIGQSKGEKEMALTLIDKFKSQPVVQVENFQCNICKPPRVFTAHSTLVSHYKSHAGIRPYVCSLCQAVFTRQHSLNYHMLIHSNQTRFTCDDCGKKFRHPSHFKEHRRRHTGESPYECSDCFTRFKTRNTYKRHLRTRHGKKLTTKGSIQLVTEDPTASTHPPEPISQAFYNQKTDATNIQQVPVGESVINFEMNYPNIVGNLSPNLATDFSHHRGYMEYPEVIPFSSESVVCSTTIPSDVILSDHAIKNDSTGAIKEYHELMPLEVPITTTAEDGDLPPVVAIPTSGPSNSAPIKCLENRVPTGSNQTLEHIQGQEILPRLALQQPNSALTFGNSNDGILFIISDKGMPITSENVTSELMNQTLSTLTKNHTKSEVCDRNQKLPEVVLSTPGEHLEARPAMRGSILSSLLTSGPGRGSLASQVGSHLVPKMGKDPQFIVGKDQSGKRESTDKWDHLMREVISLSSAVKARPTPIQLPLADSPEVTTFSKDVPIATRDPKEVYVLKCVNGNAGNSVTKVFKAKPLLPTNGYTSMVPVQDISYISKPILVTSSLKNTGQIVTNAPSRVVETSR